MIVELLSRYSGTINNKNRAHFCLCKKYISGACDPQSGSKSEAEGRADKVARVARLPIRLEASSDFSIKVDQLLTIT